jgi:type IV secretion system protein VirB9
MKKSGVAVGCLTATLLTALAGSFPSYSETIPAKGVVDGRVRSTAYNAEEVYRLYGYVGYAIELIFEEGETFAGDAGGDLDGLTVGHYENHLILKPKAPNVGSNLVIYTNRRSYRFDYSATARRPGAGTDPVMYAVRFTYPGLAKPAPSDTQQVNRDLAAGAALRLKNLDYWYCGSQEIRPIAASDDGVRTRFTFGARAELPAVFLRNADGTESLVNTNVENGDVVIQRIAARFILRRGQLTGCVVNKAYAGNGERLSSGTVAPGVSRDTRGVAP